MKHHITLLNRLLNSFWYYDEAEGLRILPFLLQMCLGQGAVVPMMDIGVEIDLEPEPREKSTSYSNFIDPEQFAYRLYSGAVGKYLGMSEGGIELRRVEADLRAFADHETQHTFIAHIDTPGGTGYGLRPLVELMRMIHEDTGKSIIGYTDSYCCSAGAWWSAGFNQFYMDPGARGGSYGVVSVLVSYHRFLKENGVDVHAFTSGKYKGAGHPFLELPEEQKKKIEGDIEKLGSEFRGEVQKLRGVKIPQEFMEGQSLSADECVEIGVCDGLVSTLDELVDMYSE